MGPNLSIRNEIVNSLVVDSISTHGYSTAQNLNDQYDDYKFGKPITNQTKEQSKNQD